MLLDFHIDSRDPMMAILSFPEIPTGPYRPTVFPPIKEELNPIKPTEPVKPTKYPKPTKSPQDLGHFREFWVLLEIP